jgi:hypothetical protein
MAIKSFVVFNRIRIGRQSILAMLQSNGSKFVFGLVTFFSCAFPFEKDNIKGKKSKINLLVFIIGLFLAFKNSFDEVNG